MFFSFHKLTDTLTPQFEGMLRGLNPVSQRIALRYLGNKFLQMGRASFGRSGQYRGNRWEPLKEGGPATLERTGALRNSLKLGYRSNYVTVSTSNPYALAQFLGSKKKGIPARRFLPVENQGKTSWRPIIAAQRILMTELSRAMTILSGGAFPRIYGGFMIPRYEKGDPTKPASSVSDNQKG